MAKTKVYLSGAMEAYAGTTKAEDWRRYCKNYFRNYIQDFEIFSPTDHYQYGANYQKSEREVFNYDLYHTKKSDIVLVNLNDVRKSIGTCIEVYEAHKSGIPVIGFMDDELPIDEMIQKIHPWIYCCVDRVETGDGSMDRALNYIIEFYS